MCSLFLTLLILRLVSCIDYLKEANDLALNYENVYKHELVALEPDEVELKQLKKFAFGSCHSLTKVKGEGATIWDTIAAYKPDIFLWNGDAVYSNENSCEEVKQAYLDMANYKPYTDFIKEFKVDGVYDDHDYGINDGDRNFPCKNLTKDYFLDFLKKPSDHYRRERDGVYFSLEYRDPENSKNSVKIIVLDVRFNRDPYKYHPNIMPRRRISFFIEAFFRSIHSYFNLRCSHKGDFLGENQWRWFEGQLYNSKASAHILVSTIQVYNKCNYQESWKLLPYAQKRLTSLLFKTKPKGLVILTGDVHYANREGDKNLYEITSSSMTHSLLLTYHFVALLISIATKLTNRDVYFYNNFGLIEYKYGDHIQATYQIINEQGEIVKSYSQYFDESIDPYTNLSKDNILCYMFHQCYKLPTSIKALLLFSSIYPTIVIFRIVQKVYKTTRFKYKALFGSDI